MLIFIDIYMFGLKLFTDLLVVHDAMRFMKILRLSALFLFLNVHRMRPCLVHVFTWWRYCLLCSISGNYYVHMIVSSRSHDGVWSRVEPVCDVWHLFKCSVGANVWLLWCHKFCEYLIWHLLRFSQIKRVKMTSATLPSKLSKQGRVTISYWINWSHKEVIFIETIFV